MTTRRELLIAFGAAAISAPLACFAQQQQPKIARIGLLEGASASSSAKWREALIAGLRERGYVESKNINIEYRWADGKYERLPALAAEMVQMKVDIIVAGSTVVVRAAQQATTAIPIVMVRTSDPVRSGFVASLARPGRNITGVSSMNAEVTSKYLELLRVAVPEVLRVTVLANPGNSIARNSQPNLSKRIQERMDKTNTITISTIQAGTASEIEAAFGTMKQERSGGLIVLGDPFFRSQARRIAELAAQHRLPTMFGFGEAVEAGGLMSYAQNSADQYFRAATYIDKILKGTKPGDLPVERPTKIELVLNLKTAKAIELAIPQELMLRADRVIK